jgi:hypothetical protein
MPEWAIPLVFVAGYVLLMKFVLPRFGITT